MAFNIFLQILFTYIKMSKDSSAKYCQNNREIIQKKLVKYVKVSNNMIAKNTKH